MFRKIHIGLLACALFFNAALQAQSTFTHNDPDELFKQAKLYYQKEQYSLAYPVFKNLNTDINNSNIPATVQSEIKYYTIVCGLLLNDAASVSSARLYVELEHNTPRVQMMAFHLGEYYFRQEQFTEALSFYDKTDVANLNNRQVADMKFKQAYSYFSMQQFGKAKPLFDVIRQIPSDPNYVDANYYYGFLAFYDKNYKQALSSFKIIENEAAYVRIVPYYVAQIYYFTGEKDKAIEYGEQVLQTGGQYYDVQFRQLIGHAYFEKRQYNKALPYLEAYISKTDKVRREDLYELSYCYYENQQYDKAITGFKELGGKEDSLAQNSMYLLADAYLKTDQKANARNAFLFCMLNSSNAAQKEVSQFNYGKLSFELGYNSIALTELQNFLINYSKSVYIPEAKNLLVQVMAGSNNYKDALALYRTLTSQSESVKKVFPKILYGRAVELINDQHINEADMLLTEIFAAAYNQTQLPYTHFWKGEIAYRNNKYDSAIHFLNAYLKSAATNGEVNANNARYTLGYAYLRTEDYAKAQQSFSQVSSLTTSNQSTVEQDALLRQADAWFMQRNYQKALQIYNHVIDNNLANADYAMYQKAIIAGAANRTNDKIILLQAIPQRYPSSGLIADVQLEIGNSYMADENYSNAISAYQQVISNKKAANLQPQTYLNLGVAYFNSDRNDDALNTFKSLISTYPNAEESDAAVEYVRNIFIEQQKTDEFFEFMRKNNKAVSYSEEDSLTYMAAELRYNNNDFDNALKGIEAYILRFPQGKNIVEANYKAAFIYNNRKDYNNALKYYNAVSLKAPNKYAEEATLQAARIYYFELNDYTNAEQAFTQLKSIAVQPDNRLEAMRGLLRTQYKLQKFGEAVTNAQELLQQKGIATDDKMMANLVIAKTYQTNNQLNEALSYYKTVIGSGKSEFSAEARFRVAEIYLAQSKLTEAENAAFEAINKSGSYDYWITKSYILLGEVYFKQQDYFNAEATLKSVAENASITALKDEAKQKLEFVIAEKNAKSKVQQ